MSRIRTVIISLILLVGFLSGVEAKPVVHTVSKSFSDSVAISQVVYNDRVMPFHSVAKDLTVKLTGKSSFAGIDAARFILSVLYFPDDWMACEFIKVKDRTVLDSLGLNDKIMISPRSLFDDEGNYLLRSLYDKGNKQLDESILRLDEKVEILYLLHNKTLFQTIEATGLPALPKWKINLEIFYNRLNITSWCYILAFISLLSIITLNLKKKFKLSFICGIPTALVAASYFTLNWILSDHIPLAGGEQVMMFMAMVLSIIALCVTFNSPWVYTATMAMSAFTALVAHLSASDPIITSLPPALSSPWMAFHVSVIMMSYSLFAILLPLSIYCLIMDRSKAMRLVPTLYKIDIAGVILLLIGIILGALWAKEAWGTYWSWDPKENWAAVTLIIYSLPLVFKKRLSQQPKIFSTILIMAFAATVVTYYGVNYMDSLHSYGSL